jgi:alkanesulfonate monooxygenase SsuD/methylene tetrahydromethanopterin reductase-like flavin-dependent oxidoreductase (luciferase family)
MPSHPPERSLYDGVQWDLQVLRWGDELGFQEAWLGEHHMAPWEPNPAPDLVVAQALLQTRRIRLGPGGFLLPFHHPAQIADRVTLLDHLSQGRFNFGVAAGQVKGDLLLFNVDGKSGQNREMVRESLEIIRRIWDEEGAFTHEGKFWTVTRPGQYDETHWPHLRPIQRPHPPIGLSGVSPGSEMHKLAGEFGYWPMSPEMSVAATATHWDSVEAGARRSGRTPSRNEWRLIRDVFVADTDAEAERLALGGMLGQTWRRYILKLFQQHNLAGFLKHDSAVADEDVTVEYCARHLWLMGSPDTVAQQIRDLYTRVGGFGVVLMQVYDYADTPDPWHRSMRLFAEEVLPRVADLVPEPLAAMR